MVLPQAAFTEVDSLQVEGFGLVVAALSRV